VTKVKASDKELALLRKKIDRADSDLIKAFASRFKAVKEVGRLKESLHIPIVQNNRWQEVIKDRLKMAKEVGLSAEFTEEVFNLIHGEAIRIQMKKSRKG
jgi:chorismate mutase